MVWTRDAFWRDHWACPQGCSLPPPECLGLGHTRLAPPIDADVSPANVRRASGIRRAETRGGASARA